MLKVEEERRYKYLVDKIIQRLPVSNKDHTNFQFLLFLFQKKNLIFEFSLEASKYLTGK